MPTSESETGTRKFSILVVDDEQTNISFLNSALKEEYQVTAARSGLLALHQIKQSRPDLILLDVMMPELNGFDVCRALKADAAFAEIPIIFLTAMDSVEGELTGLSYGGIDYLRKPVQVDLLKLRVKNHLELKQRSDLIKRQRDELASYAAELEAALARIRRLEGMLPICMHCKSIRSDEDIWKKIEVYIEEHSEAVFSHSICPTCLKLHYGDITISQQE